MYPPMALLTGWYMNRCIKEFRIKTLNFAGAGMLLISLLIFIVLEITAEYKLGMQINGIKYLLSLIHICSYNMFSTKIVMLHVC